MVEWVERTRDLAWSHAEQAMEALDREQVKNWP